MAGLISSLIMLTVQTAAAASVVLGSAIRSLRLRPNRRDIGFEQTRFLFLIICTENTQNYTYNH